MKLQSKGVNLRVDFDAINFLGAVPQGARRIVACARAYDQHPLRVRFETGCEIIATELAKRCVIGVRVAPQEVRRKI